MAFLTTSGALVTSASIVDDSIVNADVNSAAGIVDTKLATIATAGKVSGAALTLLANTPSAAGLIPGANTGVPLVTTAIPQPTIGPIGTEGLSGMSVLGNTVAHLCAFHLPYRIVVNKISIECTSLSVAGTVKLGIYSGDGQTQLIAVTTATISGTGLITTTVGGVTLPAGIYYLVVLGISTVSGDLRILLTNVFVSTSLLDDVATKAVYQGVLTVTADTLPATFDPTALTATSNQAVIFRLDT